MSFSRVTLRSTTSSCDLASSAAPDVWKCSSKLRVTWANRLATKFTMTHRLWLCEVSGFQPSVPPLTMGLVPSYPFLATPSWSIEVDSVNFSNMAWRDENYYWIKLNSSSMVGLNDPTSALNFFSRASTFFTTIVLGFLLWYHFDKAYG